MAGSLVASGKGMCAPQSADTEGAAHRTCSSKNNPSVPAPSLKSADHRYTGNDITNGGRFLSAAAAGSVSALIGSPTELIIIQQQVMVLELG